MNQFYDSAGLAYYLNSNSYRDYFSSLPEEVQAAINQQEDRIHSEEDLRNYAEYLLRKS